MAAQVPVERGQALPGVEQHERAPRGDGRRESAVDLLGERRQLARLDGDERRLARTPRQLAQQRALADAARPCSRTTLTGGSWPSRPSSRASSADRPTKPATARRAVTAGCWGA
jgi:hypothetical protein